MNLKKVACRFSFFTCSIMAAIIIVVIILNYLGFCFKAGRFLSKEEKISIAIQYILSSYPPVIDTHYEKNGVLVKNGRHRPKQPIYYKDLRSFLTENPNCCKLTKVATEMEDYSVRLEHRFIGSANIFVELKYKVKYIDKNGAERIQKHTSYVAISNCGHPWSGI